MDNSLWFKEIMSQKFRGYPISDPTKILILYAMLEKGNLRNEYFKEEILEFIYRFYIDNVVYSSKQSSVVIRKIHNYGVEDIKEILEEALYDWKNDYPNGHLNYDEQKIYLDLNFEDQDKLYFSTKKICDTLFFKYWKSKYNYNSNLTEDECKGELFENNSRFKNRVLEDMQYCVLCEETSNSKLKAVKIDPESETSKSNGLILCEKHAKLYNSKFYFNEVGRIVILENHPELDKRMRISNKFLNKNRNKFLLQNYKNKSKF